MGKILYVISISFVCLVANSCAEIDKSSESANASQSVEIWSPKFDILVENILFPSEKELSLNKNSDDRKKNGTTKKNNIFLVKQNSSGSKDWLIDLGIFDEESEIFISSDSSENVYMTLYKRNNLEGLKEFREFTVFLVKYNSSGSRDWIKILGESEVEYGTRLTVDFSDNIYVTGFSSKFESENDFKSGNTLLVKYDTFGNKIWEKTLEQTLTGFEWDVNVDSKNNLYLSGFSANIFTKNKSWQDDILQIKFNSEGIKF